MNRREMVKLAALLSALPGGLSMAIQSVLAAGVDPAKSGLQKLVGQATINGAPAREGMLIQRGDVVATGPRSEVIYVIGQDAFLQRENTVVHLLADATEDFLRITTGKLLSVFGRGRKKLQVSTATIGIRGTGCYIEAEAKQTYFCLCYGEAEVIPSGAPEQATVIRTTHHDHPITISGDPSMPTSMADAKVINHSDAELILLENLVGRRPPFQNSWDSGSTGRY